MNTMPIDVRRSTLLLPVLALLLASCFSPAQEGDEIGVTEHALIDVTLTANPNPCVTSNGASMCATTLTPTVPLGTKAQIWVSVDQDTPGFVACTDSGVGASAPWIYPGHTYRFTLHPSRSCFPGDRGVESASVIVTGHRARITASVNPCSAAPGGTCASVIGWQSGYTAAKHQLWVAGGTAPLVCGNQTNAGTSRTVAAEGTVHYDLYTATGCTPAQRGTLVASLDIRGLSQRAVRNGTKIMLGGAEIRTAGMNKHELIEQLLGYAEGNYAQDLADAAAFGVKTLRIRAAPFWPVWFNEWRNTATRANFWSKFDILVNTASSRGIKLIPSILWNAYVFADVCGEPLHAMFDGGQASCARDLAFEFTDELVTRYLNNPTILMWELTNELNLEADVIPAADHTISTYWGTPASRTAADQFSTDEMVALLRELATRIRALDPDRLIASGYADPRPEAMHLRSGLGWTADNESQMRSYMALIHPDPIDVVSVHLYNGTHNARFGATGSYNPEVLGNYVAAADAIGKPIMIGEHGDQYPHVNVDGHGNWSRATLLRALEMRIPIALTWTWKRTVGPGTTQDQFSIHPSGSPAMTDLITFHNTINTWASTAPATRSLVLPITNASFSTDADGNGHPDGWTVANPATSVRFATASEPRFDGNTVRLHNPGGGANITSSSMSVTGGSKVILSAAVKAEAAAGGSAFFGVTQLYAGGGGSSVVQQIPIDTSFGVRAMTVQLNANTTSVRAVIYTAAGGRLYVDDVRLSRL